MNSEGVFWSIFGRLVRVVDIFIHKRFMRYSLLTLFVVIASLRGAEDDHFCHFVTFWKHTQYFIVLWHFPRYVQYCVYTVLYCTRCTVALLYHSVQYCSHAACHGILRYGKIYEYSLFVCLLFPPSFPPSTTDANVPPWSLHDSDTQDKTLISTNT